ncbi:MAG: hypothetical protein CMJ90_18365 [Planctomycetes bacterium]|nr:hypothetical protein [Planctomycetota bacterium]
MKAIGFILTPIHLAGQFQAAILVLLAVIVIVETKSIVIAGFSNMNHLQSNMRKFVVHTKIIDKTNCNCFFAGFK